MSQPVNEYDARIDSKKRITIRGARAEIYHVREHMDGTIVLSPRVLVHPHEISGKTFKMVDSSARNLKEGHASQLVVLQVLDDLTD